MHPVLARGALAATVLAAVLGTSVLTPADARAAGDDPVAATLAALFEANASESIELDVDRRLADRLEAIRPTMVHSLRRLNRTRLLMGLDSLLASYLSIVSPTGPGEARPARSVASWVATDLATVVRWGDPGTTAVAMGAANVVGVLDVVITRRRLLRERAGATSTGGPESPIPMPPEVQLLLDARLDELLQLNYDLVGVPSLQVGGALVDTRSGKKLRKLDEREGEIAAEMIRRLVMLGRSRVTDARLGPGLIARQP